MSPRTGRPKAEEPKDFDVKVRLDGKTHSRLMEYCKNHSISKAEAIRQGIHLLLDEKEKDTATLDK